MAFSQMRRSAVSIPSNIAEGTARNSHKEFIKFLYIAQGSLAEIETQLLLAKRLHLLNKSDVFDDMESIRKMLSGLIRFLKTKKNLRHYKKFLLI